MRAAPLGAGESAEARAALAASPDRAAPFPAAGALALQVPRPAPRPAPPPRRAPPAGPSARPEQRAGLRAPRARAAPPAVV